jgi:phosphonate transport system permease protein
MTAAERRTARAEPPSSREARVEELRAQRPRSRLVRASLVALAALVAYAWLSGDVPIGDLFNARRVANVERFAREEIWPHALIGRPLDLRALVAWMRDLLVAKHGASGALATLAIAVLAITLAGAWALFLVPFAARNVSARVPFDSALSSRSDRKRAALGWRAVVAAARALLIFLRAIPEYVWAFLLLAMLGPTAWPAVLALAIHNAGILGKLGAETVENLERAPLSALRDLGAKRAQIGVFAVLPLSLSRFLLYFFYRFETCVREATVLGMLGVVSLGYWIQDARAKHFYDEMLFFVALGASMVLAGDLVSAIARRALRRAA